MLTRNARRRRAIWRSRWCWKPSEVLELYQWSDAAPDQAELSGELADVMLYLIQLASISGIDLGQAVMDKLDVNYGRTWDQEVLSDEQRAMRQK